MRPVGGIWPVYGATVAACGKRMRVAWLKVERCGVPFIPANDHMVA